MTVTDCHIDSDLGGFTDLEGGFYRSEFPKPRKNLFILSLHSLTIILEHPRRGRYNLSLLILLRLLFIRAFDHLPKLLLIFCSMEAW